MQRWPSDDTIAHLVVVDHQRPLHPDDIRESVEAARASGPVAIRTGALFPDTAEAFAAEGFQVIDTLALLERDVRRGAGEIRRSARRARGLARDDGFKLRGFRRRDLDGAADIDRAAFGAEWGHRAASLARISAATPQARERVVTAHRRPVGFAITGLGHGRGYLQRLCVDPADQRRGLGRLLVLDALFWLRRKGAANVMVNTGVDNEPALALYRSLGFHSVSDRLRVMELVVDA